ncbi:unnamed protein product [Dicrocoelium dendriticum]|nr:unnamed protein product [Dicrocoelium dendriticum]
MKTRRMASMHCEETSSGSRQVGDLPVVDDHVSCPGSHSSRNGSHVQVSVNARNALKLAELKKRQADTELELAKLRLEMEEEVVTQEHLPTVSHVPKGGEEQMSRFLKDCQEMAPHKVDPVSYPQSSLAVCYPFAELPKVELEYFDGDPSSYWRFIKQFEYFVENRVIDNGQRLLYLVYYCRGRANEAIRECTMLPPEQAYDRARCILRDLFGQNHVVARSLIDGLLTGLKPMADDSEALSRLSLKMESCYVALSQMNYMADLDSIATIERIVRFLPSALQSRWARVADSIVQEKREVRFCDLAAFVATEARVARSRFGQIANANVARSQLAMHPPRLADKGKGRNLCFCTTAKRTNRVTCIICDGEHDVESCTKFLAMDVPGRWELIRAKAACYNCLGSGHRSATCRNRKGCNVSTCNGRHHSLLHHDKAPNPSRNEYSSCNVTSTAPGRVSLGVVPVRLDGPVRSIETYALLDSGSDVTLVQEDLLREAGVKVSRTSLTMQTVSGLTSLEAGLAKFRLSALRGPEYVTVERAYCLKRLPLRPVACTNGQLGRHWPHLSDIQFDALTDTRVRILIGADVPEAHWQLERRACGRKRPFAARTPLGWILLGPVNTSPEGCVSVHCVQEETTSIETQLKMLYDGGFESAGSSHRSLSMEDKAALEIAENSVRLVEGHFEVALPWRKRQMIVPNNFVSALHRLHCLSRRLVNDPTMCERYTAALETSIAKGYAALVPSEQLQPSYTPRWYLPHHAVINPKKPEKLRVVFDCAAKHKGLSLNDQLLQGPDTTANLTGILMRFRSERVAISADIEDMFMQVKVPAKDRAALRFLWWKNNVIGSEVVEYQMTAHPFGATSSPFCANFALRQTAKAWGHQYSENVSAAVCRDFYVDDLLISLPTPAEARSFVTQIREMLSRGGFKLCKWVCNIDEVYEVVPSAEIAEAVKPIAELPGLVSRTLGLSWDSKQDVFLFHFAVSEGPNTRRGILSVVSSIFDPLGMIAPLIMPVKLLLQQLCRDKVGWDELITGDSEAAWHTWIRKTKALGFLKIPRCIRNGTESLGPPQLHIFCDASETGYGAVAYARFRIKDNRRCALLYSKSRVAPLKTVSIPRLELTAAVLATRVFEDVTERAQLEFENVWFWTDSTTVLYYINDTSKRFSTFVSNRLSVIHELTDPSQWKHVMSGSNPADILSRGSYSSARLESWFHGPDFLLSDNDEWPDKCLNSEPRDIELKRVKVQVNMVACQSSLSSLIRRYSDWFKLLKSVVWLTRFKRYLKARAYDSDIGPQYTSLITLHELKGAEFDVIRLAQNEVYGDEIKRMEETKEGIMPPKRKARQGSLSRLCPILRDGILCLGGRLAYSDYDSSFKFPVIIPPKHAVTALLIRFYHILEGHSGASQVLTSLRRKYWIVRGLSAVKRVIGSCWICRRRLATAGQQMMAPLPLVRIEKGWYPFRFVGVDYFGPFIVKHGRKQEKRYGCLFTCLQTRAVHIEMSYTLNTDSFIMALMRFIARRGTPAEIFSDNGGNFVGAVAELRAAMKGWSEKHINDKLLLFGVQWHFNPPAASHRGGIWERIVRSVRRILLSVATQQALTEEALVTLITEAERIINSRPLVPLTSDSTDRPALTPNDLLILRPNPSGLLSESVADEYRRCWRQVNYLTALFWKRWVREYLPLLNCREKWLNPCRNFKPGDVVLVVSETVSRNMWPLGVVESCVTSQDGLVRTVNVRTKDGLLKRDVRKVCLLEGSRLEGGVVPATGSPQAGGGFSNLPLQGGPL